MQDILSILQGHDRFLISTHISPDGDAIGSQIGLGRFLEGQGKEVAMINSDPMPYNLTWLTGSDAVEVFDGSMAQRERIDAAEVVIVADTNAKQRLGKLDGPVESNRGIKVLIDHHTHPETWFDAEYRNEAASSTGELVFELIDAWAPEAIDKAIAQALYTAIMTDTGSFRYNSVTPRVHRIVAELLPPPSSMAYVPRPPSEREFRAVVDEFWWETLYVAKHVRRGELLPARYSLETVLRYRCLVPMLEWYVQIERQWEQTVGVRGSGLRWLLPQEDRERLDATYGGDTLKSHARALEAMVQLFSRAARAVARDLGYRYPGLVESETRGLLEL